MDGSCEVEDGVSMGEWMIGAIHAAERYETREYAFTGR
jgi:hypothetical protein